MNVSLVGLPLSQAEKILADNGLTCTIMKADPPNKQKTGVLRVVRVTGGEKPVLTVCGFWDGPPHERG